MQTSVLPRAPGEQAFRKTVTFTGIFFLIVCCLALTKVASLAAAVIAVCILFAGLGTAVVGYSPTAAELLPEHGDIFFGIAAAAGSVGALIFVSATGVIVEQTGSYDKLFLILAAMNAVTGILYLILGKAEPLTIRQGAATMIDLGLNPDQETRAQSLHRELIVIDMLTRILPA